ncbi:hypothetical protein BDV96DRAFT_372802 [Lophiotrema nucula]|uniref:Uncharacterized protein n=1 Tax=Lophiotrema nucula TaxID=690887 RepID=A0A6A5ZLQ7_9PLEO|nr:hypothetical protein BDV96DRAFT_372802 [Lophiotrema nucula]
MILGVPIQEQLPGEWALAGSKGFTKSMFSGSWRPSPTLSRFGPGTNSFTSWQGEPFGDSAASMEAPSKTPGSAVETSAHRNNTVQVRVTPDAEESSVSIESSNPTISQSYVAKQMPESTSGSRPRQAKDLAPIANAFMSSKIAEGSYFALGVQTPNLSETASNSATTTQASQDQISRKLSLPANFHGRLRNAVESNRRYSAVFVDPRPAPQPRRVSANLEVANDPIYSAPPESDVSSQAQHESSDHANTRAKAKQLKAKKLPKKGWRFSGSDLDVPPILPTPRAKAKQLKAKNKSKKEWRFSDPDLNIPPSPTTFPPPAWL